MVTDQRMAAHERGLAKVSTRTTPQPDNYCRPNDDCLRLFVTTTICDELKEVFV